MPVDGTIQLGYKNTAWFTANASLVLLVGQIVYLEQTGTYKLGDGVTQLSALTFLGGNGLSYTPEDVANKSLGVNTDQASNTKYPSVKAVFDWVTSLFVKKGTLTTNTIPKATASDTIGDSSITDDGTLVTVNSGFYATNGSADVSAQGTSAYMSADQQSNTNIESNLLGNEFTHNLKNTFDAPANYFPQLTASQIVETDASKNLVSVAKQSGYNLPIGTTAGTVLEGDKLPFVTPEMYGAVGDGSTDDATAIQNAVNSGLPVYFHNKTYKVNSQITVDNSAAMVIIYGNNAKLLSGISSVGHSIFRIYQANKIFITNLNFNFNASATAHYGLRLGYNAGAKYVGVARVTNCDFYNFGVENQRGMFVENTPFVSGLAANFNLPSLLIDGCNFYNQNTTNTVNYTTATWYGIGIQLGELTDYCKITNCNFNFIRIAVWSAAGANLDVTVCNFLGCLPKQVSAYTYGVIYVPNTGTNNGKINVVGCKFNHNYGYCFYYAYATAERPVTISGCHFIANATTIFYATHSSAVATRHRIVNNYFERSSQAYTNAWTGQPFGASLQPFIYLNNQTRCLVRMNTFLNDGSYGVTSANSADYNIVKNNSWYNITGITSLVGANNQVADNDNL